MDIVAAAFPDTAEAVSAASDLASELHLDPDLVTVTPVEEPSSPARGAEPRAAAVIVVAWVREQERPDARDVLWRHHGRHVPFDWLAATRERALTPASPIAASQSLIPVGL